MVPAVPGLVATWEPVDSDLAPSTGSGDINAEAGGLSATQPSHLRSADERFRGRTEQMGQVSGYSVQTVLGRRWPCCPGRRALVNIYDCRRALYLLVFIAGMGLYETTTDSQLFTVTSVDTVSSAQASQVLLDEIDTVPAVAALKRETECWSCALS
jgi:hypothetical protein